MFHSLVLDSSPTPFRSSSQACSVLPVCVPFALVTARLTSSDSWNLIIKHMFALIQKRIKPLHCHITIRTTITKVNLRNNGNEDRKETGDRTGVYLRGLKPRPTGVCSDVQRQQGLRCSVGGAASLNNATLLQDSWAAKRPRGRKTEMTQARL